MHVMLNRLHTSRAVFFGILFASTTSGYADTHLIYTETSNTPPRQTQIHIHQGKVRMQEADSHTYILYDHSKSALYNVNLKSKQYITTTPQTLHERVQQTSTLQRETQAALAQQRQMMPDAQREAVEAQSKTAASTTTSITLVPTDQQDTVAKLPCTIVQLKVDTQVQRDICQAKADAIPQDDLQTLVAMFSFLDKIAALSATAQGKQPPAEGTAMLHKAGLALRIKATSADGYHSELTEWDTTTQLDAEQFTLPADFRNFEPSIKDAPPKQPIIINPNARK